MKRVAALYSDHYGEAPLCNTAEVVVVNIVCDKFVLLNEIFMLSDLGWGLGWEVV